MLDLGYLNLHPRFVTFSNVLHLLDLSCHIYKIHTNEHFNFHNLLILLRNSLKKTIIQTSFIIISPEPFLGQCSGNICSGREDRRNGE